MKITLHEAREADRELIKNIFNIYQNELSVYSRDFLYLDEKGYFAPETVEEILPFGDGVFPYIIRADGRNIGFILITDKNYAPGGADYCIEELFVVAAMRGTGAAEEAVSLLTRKNHGLWALEVYRENARALAFWQKYMKNHAAHCAVVPAKGNMLRMTFLMKTKKHETNISN